jgi:hypothetical protein
MRLKFIVFSVKDSDMDQAGPKSPGDIIYQERAK